MKIGPADLRPEQGRRGERGIERQRKERRKARRDRDTAREDGGGLFGQG